MITVAPPVVHPSLGLIALIHGVAVGCKNRPLIMSIDANHLQTKPVKEIFEAIMNIKIPN